MTDSSQRSVMRSMAQNGKLVFCTDIGYPPMEFFKDGVPAGADIEIAREIARRMELDAEFIDTPVAEIIDALLEFHSDVIINAFTDNPERRERVAFVDYLSVGQTVVVAKGNPKGITKVEDLADLHVLVQADTSNELSLRKLDADNQAKGLPPMRISAFKGTTGETVARAAAAMRAGNGDADFLDIINARWAAREEEVEVAPFIVNQEPYGICVRPDETDLQNAVLTAVKSMYEDGTIQKILERWGLSDLAFRDIANVKINACTS
jgi:polar amino acid transport system substrate-binding protein